jgi:hypothetical protein
MNKLSNPISCLIKNNPKLVIVFFSLIVFTIFFWNKDGNLALELYAILTLLVFVCGLFFAYRQNEPLTKKLPKITLSKQTIKIISTFLTVSLLATAIFCIPDIRIKSALIIGAASTIPVIIFNVDTWHRRLGAYLLLSVTITQLVFTVSGKFNYSPASHLRSQPKPATQQIPPLKEEDSKNNINNEKQQIEGKIESLPQSVIVQIITIIAATIIILTGEIHRNNNSSSSRNKCDSENT